MALVSDTISNFIGGVSQQPSKLMFPNQAKEIINMTPDPAVGLAKRNPTEYVARLMDKLNIYPKTHTIIKEDEKYTVYLTGSGIKVFDLEGNEKTVNLADDKVINYITTSVPMYDLDMTTIGDYTFILNKTKVTKLKDDLYPNPYPNAAIIFVKQGDYAIEYDIEVNGTQQAQKITSNSDISDTKTLGIAQSLYDQLVSKLGTTDWIFAKKNSTILLRRKDKASFTILARDSNGDRNLFAFYNESDSLTTLPLTAPNGFILKIKGDKKSETDDYYVKFKTSDGSEFGNGSWSECCAPNIKYKIDETTMPHALIRESDGTFTFKSLTWTDRKAGDETTAKTPSVFGNKINEVFTHKGRLAFLAGDKSLYSDVEDIFSFFKKTTLTKLDTDPIDVGSNSRMVDLYHSLPFNSDLLLFSNSSEFTIKGGDTFTNSTVTIDLTMEYSCSRYCKPISIGDTALFVYENGEYSGVYELYTASTYAISARKVTDQVIHYLPKDIFKIAASPQNNIATFISSDTKDTIYLYNYYYTSEKKAQSAWHKWVFNNAVILNCDFDENYLYITAQYSDGVYLLKINLTSNQAETDLEFLCYLDRKVYLTGTYNTSTDKTTVTLPYTPINSISVVDAKTGFLVDTTITDKALTIEGNHTSIIAGDIYNSDFILSTIYQRQQVSEGSLKVVDGLLIVRDINIGYADSLYFKIDVEPLYSSYISSSFEFTGKKIGEVSAITDKFIPDSSTFLVPVGLKNEDVEIKFINDSYLPCCFLNLTWLGEMSIRGQKS
jgi:hypothetical protein